MVSHVVFGTSVKVLVPLKGVPYGPQEGPLKGFHPTTYPAPNSLKSLPNFTNEVLFGIYMFLQISSYKFKEFLMLLEPTKVPHSCSCLSFR